ncbi:MAG TPA: serine/threonine-protein kinase, partial [Urbifossiella sp.]|nr:serine/threonine-protein kinase [Urbifossiella sp.]
MPAALSRARHCWARVIGSTSSSGLLRALLRQSIVSAIQGVYDSAGTWHCSLDQSRPPNGASMVAHASPLIGITSWVPGQRLLDDFVVDRPLGAGGMGVVYLVRSESTGQRFAVKKTDENEARPRHALLTELRTLTDLPHHPHLVTYCFFRTIEGAVALFTEFVAGGTLGDSVRNGKLTRLDQILDVAIQSAWGLHAVHELGFVHQDVKPPNLLLTPDGVVKVADFGLASICSAGLTEPLTGGGSDTLTDGLNTIEYCAPEQAAGGRVTRKCDVWSWGVSVLEMFYGGPPCGAGPLGAGPLAAFVLDDFLVRGNGADGRPAISLALADVLRGCFRDDPSDRPASMADVAEEVRSIYRCETGAEHPRPVPAAPRPAGGARGPERTTPFRLEWEDPAEALREALRDAGRAPAEADPFLPPRAGSRRAFAVADLEPYGEAIRVYERLAATGRSGFEARLSQLYMGKAYVHETLSDLPGTIACCDRAIEIRERLTDGRPDAGGHLAAALVYKGVTLWTLRDPRAAAAVYDRAIETCGRPGGAAGAGGR